MMKKLWEKLAIAALAAVPATVMLTTEEASADTVYTVDYSGETGERGDWKWLRYNDEEDYTGFPRLINQKTGEKLPEGWHLIDDYWYYIDDRGFAFDHFHDGYYLGSETYCGRGSYGVNDAPMRFEWQKDDRGWTYVAVTGDEKWKNWWAIQWITNTTWVIDGKVYWFDLGGYLTKAGWCESHNGIETEWRYIKSDGSCVTGWKKIGGKWYFFDHHNGLMVTGSYDTSDIDVKGQGFYFFDADGAWVKKTGWVKNESGEWYYIGQDGKCCTGWKKSGGKWYFFNDYDKGKMASSFPPVEEYFYKGCYTYVDGYYIDEDGVMRGGGYSWHKDANGWWYGKGSYYEKDREDCIDGVYCQFDSDGYLTSSYNMRTGEELVYNGLTVVDSE